MKTKLILIILSFLQLAVTAQKAPIKFGKVDKADLEMKVYPADTSAPAAILCDYGYFSAAGFQFVRTLRIKIFKKEGTVWGNQFFPVSSKAEIRGITFNLENGEIVESKLKSESTFEERVTKSYYRTRVAMPNVKEGSIIDLEFRYLGLPNEWRFQDEIPVRWSELIIEPSPIVTFRKNFFGFQTIENKDIRSVGKDMPAFKKEPFISSSSNYISKYEIEILKIQWTEFCTTWDAVNLRLRENNFFGRVMEGCTFLNPIVKDIESKYTDPVEKLKAAHEAIKKAIQWNEEESLFSTSSSLLSAFNKKIGNSADINLMLVKLLQKLNFEAYPLALSTRKNGFLSPINPSLSKLNYVAAYVLIGDKTYFLDATEEFLPMGMLPDRCINLNGRLIDEYKSDWVNLMVNKKERKLTQFDLKLESNQVLTGTFTRSSSNFTALEFRKLYHKFNSQEEYLKDFESLHNGLSVVNCSIENLDSIYLPLKETYQVKLKNNVKEAGNLLYINPLLFEQITSNPFKAEERKYPVDFIYPSEKSYLFKLTLPEGAQVVELPKPVKMNLEDGSASVQYKIDSSGNVVQLYYTFVLNKAIYSEAEYSNLRALYSELVKKHTEQIVIKTI